MSVYVRGMQMPDRCSHCPLRYVDHSGTAVCKAANAIVILPKDRTRPEYCPLVDLSAEDVRPVVYAAPVRFYDDPFTGRLLTTCSRCDQKVSQKDAYCRHCGASFLREVRKNG